jgi:dTMP kinase
VFVVLEGIDGAGTTTQAARLCDALEKDGIAAVKTREPSDGPIGTLIRRSLTDKSLRFDPTTMGLLFAADRIDHVEREIEPALKAGRVVISDRYYHSSLAYQGQDVDRQWIKTINQRARRPDLTLILEVSVAVAEARRKKDQRPEELFDARETQTRVAQNYKKLADWLGREENVVTIDGERSADEVFREVFRRVIACRAEKR